METFLSGIRTFMLSKKVSGPCILKIGLNQLKIVCAKLKKFLILYCIGPLAMRFPKGFCINEYQSIKGFS